MLFNDKKARYLLLILVLVMTYSISAIVICQKQISNVENENEILKESEKLKDSEILELDSKLKSTSEKLKESEESVLSLTDEVFNLNSKLEKLQGESDNLKEEIGRKDSEISELKKKISKAKKIDVVATAYTAGCRGCTGITYTGYDVRNTVYEDGKRVIATDPNIIPLGSTVKVESETMSFTGIASDIGSAIKGNRIDVLVENKGKAVNFGVQDAEITIIEKGGG